MVGEELPMILQLNPMIPVDTPLGKGYACGWIDYSQEHHLIWIVLLDAGYCYQFENDEIHVIANRTLKRKPTPKNTSWKKKAGL